MKEDSADNRAIRILSQDIKIDYGAGDIPRISLELGVLAGQDLPTVEEIGIAIYMLGVALENIEKYEKAARDWLEKQIEDKGDLVPSDPDITGPPLDNIFQENLVYKRKQKR